MSELGYLLTFAAIALLTIGLSLWMMWYSRRAMRSHKEQIEGIIREMREVIDGEKKADPDGDGASPRPRDERR